MNAGKSFFASDDRSTKIYRHHKIFQKVGLKRWADAVPNYAMKAGAIIRHHVAPDKYYGLKNKLKESSINVMHKASGLSCCDESAGCRSIRIMYYDFKAGKPTAIAHGYAEATHPFNVFFDLNHESAYTQQYLDTVNYYWIHEYRFDGYRFDLSKGFTQKNAAGNVSSWGQYDASRIAILKRMADKIWNHSPDAYVILEHLLTNWIEGICWI